MTDTNINFNKRKLESLKSSTKPIWYYAKNFEGLALFVGKKKKTYYAHWAIPVVDKITASRFFSVIIFLKPFNLFSYSLSLKGNGTLGPFVN